MGVLSEIINPALIRTRNDSLTDIDTTTDVGQKAVILYEDIVRTAMGTYPWPFLTKAVQLKRIGTNSDHHEDYQYDFRLPADYLFIWDFYDSVQRRPAYGPSWDFSSGYVPFTWPLDGTHSVHGNFGRIVDGVFNSDYNEVFALYTPRPDEDKGLRHISIKGWSPQFKEYVKRECMLAYEQGFSQDAEISLPNMGIHEREKRRMKSQAAIENRKANRLPESRTLATIRAYLRD